MKLIALKNISATLPKGTVFEKGGTRARVLIAIKAAAVYTEPAPAPPKAVEPPDPTEPTTAPEPLARPRNTRVGAGTFNRYQRRDLQAEDSK